MFIKRNGMSENEAGYLGYLASKDTREANYKIRVEEYYKNPNKCKYCNKIIDYKHRNNSFCSNSCSASYNNHHRNKVKYVKHDDTIRYKNPDNAYTIINKNEINESNIEFINNKLLSLSHPRYYDLKTKLIYNYKKSNINNFSNKKCKYCGCVEGHCKDSCVCEHYRLFKSLEKFGFDKTKIGTLYVIDEFYKIRDLLEYEYKVNRITNNELISKYNYKSGLANFHKLLKSLGIVTYTQSESLIIAVKIGRNIITSDNINYKTEYHKSWNGKVWYLRSSYETDFANILDNNKIDYEVETLKIEYMYSLDNKKHISIPDFYLPSENIIYEIKSVWTLLNKVQQMKDKFIAYIEEGYTPKLILEHKEVDINSLTEENILSYK